MDMDEFFKKSHEIIDECEESLYKLSKKQIIQDDIGAPKTTSNSSSVKTNASTQIDNNSSTFNDLKNNFKSAYTKLMENINLRNNLSKFFGFLIYILSVGCICYCIFIPLKKINYSILICSIICLFISNYLYRRLWIKVKNVCPECHENDAIISKGTINKELVSTKKMQDPYKIYNLNRFIYTNRNVCKYCNYFKDSQWEKNEEELISYTDLGLLRLENERHERAMAKKVEAMQEAYEQHLDNIRQENMRHEEADLRNRKEANDDFIQKQEEAWERRRRGY